MAGRPPEVDHVRDGFLAEISSARGLLTALSNVPQQVHPNAPRGLHPKHVRQIYELAFMGIVAAWEEFLELALVRYVAGARARNGYAPTPRYGLATNLTHAYELLARKSPYDPGKDYLKVSDEGWVRANADFFFSSHPFSILRNNAQLLKHANSIRNRVAHNSAKCRADFKSTAIFFLAPANGALTQGFAAGDLLRTHVERHFSVRAVQANVSHFDAYASLYEQLAQAIVP